MHSKIGNVLLLMTAVAAATPLSAQGDRAASLLAAARVALGGDRALNAVKAWAVSGSLSRDIGPIVTESVFEVRCALPDKFIQTFRQSVMRGPLGASEIMRSEGFNGDSPISAYDGPSPPFAAIRPVGAATQTPADVAAARARQLLASKHTFVTMALPLLARSFEAYPLEFTAAGTVTLSTASADVIEAKGPDSWTARLFLDATTHLPVRVSWMAKPVVVFATRSVVNVPVNPQGQAVGPPEGARGGPMPPAGDPTVGLADLEWVTELGDYRVTDGLKWPHRWTTTYGGRKYDDLRLRDFKINLEIDPKTFTP